MHDIGPPHQKSPALGNALDRFQLPLNPWQESPHRTRPKLDHGVDTDDRTAFGRSVSFHHPESKFLRPKCGRGVLEFLGSGHQILDGLKVILIRLASVPHQEGVGAHHHGAGPVINHLRNDPVMQR